MPLPNAFSVLYTLWNFETRFAPEIVVYLPMTCCAQGKELPPIDEEAVGIVQPEETVEEPFSSVWKSTSVLSDLASRTAPSIFNWPAPCSKVLAPAIGCALYCSSMRIIPGVRFGLT